MTDQKNFGRCPQCERGLLVRRVNSVTGEPFLGCDHYPDCKFTKPYSEAMRMRELGQPEFPLFENGEKNARS